MCPRTVWGSILVLADLYEAHCLCDSLSYARPLPCPLPPPPAVWGPVLVLADFCNVVEMAKLTLFWTLCYFTTAVAEDYGEHKAHEEAEKED